MADTTEVSFVLAFPGWEVLYYFKGGRFESAPIVAWAIHAVEGSFARAVPVTTDMAWSLEDDRPICTPDGDVTLGDLERWPSVWAWLDDMKKREVNNPESLPPTPSIPLGNKRGAPVLALDSFRGKFER